MISGDPASLKPRVCLRCKQKKIRCDREEGCSQCLKHNAQCSYPEVFSICGTRSAHSRRSLSSRIQKLEGILLSGLSEVQMSTAPSQTSNLQPPPTRTGILSEQLQDMSQSVKNSSEQIENGRLPTDSTSDHSPPSESCPRLCSSPASENNACNRLFFRSQSTAGLSTLQLSTAQKTTLWSVYKENFDPVIKILHRPTIEDFFRTNSKAQIASNSETTALLSAIYVAAVVTVDTDECQRRLGLDKATLMAHSRSCLEFALSEAGFLTSTKIGVYQAFAIYIVCLHGQEGGDMVCKLTRIALGLARSQGFHRDGEKLGLNPFETEMRRRLWWVLLSLDTRFSEEEENGSVSAVYLDDVNIPLNINDSDLVPHMTSPPEPRKGCTDITLSLVRFELVATWQQMMLLACIRAYSGTTEPQNFHNQDELIAKCRANVMQKYLCEPEDMPNSNCSENEHTSRSKSLIQRISELLVQLLTTKIWFTTHEASTLQPQDPASHAANQEQLFHTAINILELYNKLCEEISAAHWSWLFRNYIQWRCLNFVLMELCRRPLDDTTKRAWRAVDAIHDGKTLQEAENRRGGPANPFWKLREVALAHRIRQSLTSISQPRCAR